MTRTQVITLILTGIVLSARIIVHITVSATDIRIITMVGALRGIWGGAHGMIHGTIHIGGFLIMAIMGITVIMAIMGISGDPPTGMEAALSSIVPVIIPAADLQLQAADPAIITAALAAVTRRAHLQAAPVVTIPEIPVTAVPEAVIPRDLLPFPVVILPEARAAVQAAATVPAAILPAVTQAAAIPPADTAADIAEAEAAAGKC